MISSQLSFGANVPVIAIAIHRRIVLGALCLVVCASAPAQQSFPMVLAQDSGPQTNQPSQSTQSGDPGTISGTVFSAETGEPLPEAHLRLLRLGAYGPGNLVGAITDARGNFQFVNLNPGRYLLTAYSPGYATQIYGRTRPGASDQLLDLSSGGTLSKIVFRLVRAGIITGHVTDENGHPIKGAGVRVVRKLYTNGEIKLAFVGGGSTNALGQYRVPDLPPGRYYLLVDGPGNNGSSAYPTEYYPGVAGITHATPVIVNAGDEVPGMDIALTSVQTHRIRGRVVGVEDCGRRGGAVLLVGQSDDGQEFMRDGSWISRQEGTFEIDDIIPGSYSVGFECGNGMPVPQLPVSMGNADVDGVSLAVTPGANISVAVKLEGQGTAAATNMQVRLEVKNPMLGNRPSAEVQSDGSFLFTQVGDGTYSINVTSACRTCYLKSATAGSVDVLQDGVQVSSGTGPSSIQLVYSSETGAVTGTVTTDGDTPAANARVVLVPDAPFRHSDRYRTGFTDSTGKYQLQGVPPGHYEAFAWEAIDDGAYEDPDLIQAFQNQSESVEVEANETKAVDLKLIPANASGEFQ